MNLRHLRPERVDREPGIDTPDRPFVAAVIFKKKMPKVSKTKKIMSRGRKNELRRLRISMPVVALECLWAGAPRASEACYAG
jgi:hypothetical protein